MKVVINKCHGGFSVSPLALREIGKRKGFDVFFYAPNHKKDSYDMNAPYYRLDQLPEESIFLAATKKDLGAVSDTSNVYADGVYISERDFERNDADLVAVVKKLGAKANGTHAKLKIVEIPDGVNYEIDDYDGMESIDEVHRSWG